MRQGFGFGMADAPKRVRAFLLAAVCSTLTSGCVAPLLAGAAAGAGVFGVNEGISALQRRELAGDDRLRHISASSLNISSDDIASISDKNWRGSILHWVVTHRNGRRFRCEAGAGSGNCTPFPS